MNRVLFIPDMGGVRTAERTPLLYRTLKANHEVVGVPAPLDRLIYDPARARVPRYVLYVLDKVLTVTRGLLLARRHSIDLVVCATSHHALPGLVLARILGVRCIWESQGNVKLFAESLEKGWFFTSMNVLLERFIGKRVDALITVSQRDADAYVEMGVPRAKLHIIPISVVLSEIDAEVVRPSEELAAIQETSGSPRLLFFGSFKYEPNLDALRFLNESLAPHLEREGVEPEIFVAGRDIPGWTYHPSIRPLGFVHEIHQLLRLMDLSLVPIRKGVGILTKVLDAMAVGTPVVLTEFAANLIPGIRGGVNAFVAADEGSFPGVVLRALSRPDERDSMAKEARRLMEKEYDWGSYVSYLEDIVEGRIVDEPPEG